MGPSWPTCPCSPSHPNRPPSCRPHRFGPWRPGSNPWRLNGRSWISGSPTCSNGRRWPGRPMKRNGRALKPGEPPAPPPNRPARSRTSLPVPASWMPSCRCSSAYGTSSANWSASAVPWTAGAPPSSASSRSSGPRGSGATSRPASARSGPSLPCGSCWCFPCCCCRSGSFAATDAPTSGLSCGGSCCSGSSPSSSSWCPTCLASGPTSAMA